MKTKTAKKTSPKPKKLPKSGAKPTAGTAGTLVTTPTATSPPATTDATAAGLTVVTPPSRLTNKVQVVNYVLALVAAFRANYALTDTMELPSGTYTIEELIDEFTSYTVAATNLSNAVVALHKQVVAEQALEKSTMALRAEVKGVLVGKLGRSSPELSTYGFKPYKAAAPKPATKVAAAAKGKSTRGARDTEGKAEKDAVTGDVTGVTITPVTGKSGS